MTLEPSGAALLKRVEPFRIESFDSRCWPGTELLHSLAHVTHYRLCSESLAILLECTRALYDWRQPRLPEDLFTLRAEGSAKLGTIAHERDAFLELSDDEGCASIRL